jgi:hypothetical protein
MCARLVLAFAFGAALLGGSVPASAQAAKPAAGFLAGTEDVPLAPGLKNQEKTLIVFDKPEGRIVEIEARGKATRQAVESFYATSLPELGWVLAGPHRWQREHEALRFDITGRDGDLSVAFQLTPR